MEFMTGVKKKEDISVKTLLETPEGTEVKLEGAVNIIRDMGEVAFVILRKSEGLVQCVYEEGSVDFPLKDLKEESAVAVTGTVKKEDRAPGGVEVRLQTITVLSEPTISCNADTIVAEPTTLTGSGIHRNPYTEDRRERR